MPIPDFIVDLRKKIGTDLLFMPGCTAVIRREHHGRLQVLLVQRADNGAWTPITGIVDPGEEPAHTAVREAMEEAGVEIRIDRVAAVSATSVVTYDNGDRACYLDVAFACTWVGGDARVNDDESQAVQWVDADKIGELVTSPEMMKRIERALSDQVAASFVHPGDARVS